MIQKDLPSVAALAFLGDAVHSLFVREHLAAKHISHAKDLNALAQDYVTATAQALAYERVAPHLSEEEQDVFRRAFNSSHLNRPKHTSGETYRTATGFEAVLGMLHHTGNQERLNEVLRLAYEGEDLLK